MYTLMPSSHIASTLVGVDRTILLLASESTLACRGCIRYTFTLLALHCKQPWCELVCGRRDGIVPFRLFRFVS